MRRNDWIDAIVALATLGAIVAQIASHDPKLRAAAIRIKQRAGYEARLLLRDLRRWNEPAWRTELRDYCDTETVPIP